jgi:NOL1/NOP2/sun family putative RNA methylase
MNRKYEPKPLFLERMRALLPDKKDFESYMKILEKKPVKSIRCNTLKISPEKLKKKLEGKGWKIKQPFKGHNEIMVVDGYENGEELAPGELGRALEHMLGYYYVQELASMLPVLALKPKPGEIVLDLAASPGSKTTQIAAKMENSGVLIANEISLGRIKILAANTERCGTTNVIITKKEGTALCKRFKREGLYFDKILVDAPCSGEGTLRSTPMTYKMWSINTVKKLSKIQKHLLSSAIEILKPNGEIVYSTCTHSPEENEGVISYVLKEFNNVEIETISLPVKCRPGITSWEEEKYGKEVTKSCRVYPQDNNTEGFFIAKLRKVK